MGESVAAEPEDRQNLGGDLTQDESLDCCALRCDLAQDGVAVG